MGSSSTPDRRSTDTPRKSVRLIRRDEVLTAYQLDQEQIVPTKDHDLRGFPQDWIVAKGDQILDVLSPAQFVRMYEETGKLQLVIDPNDRTELEKRLGFGSTNTSLDLTNAVIRLARCKIGGIEVNFTPSQWEEIARRADKRRMKPSEYMQTIVDRFVQDVWTTL